jgi:hypothetical protein
MMAAALSGPIDDSRYECSRQIIDTSFLLFVVFVEAAQFAQTSNVYHSAGYTKYI